MSSPFILVLPLLAGIWVELVRKILDGEIDIFAAGRGSESLQRWRQKSHHLVFPGPRTQVITYRVNYEFEILHERVVHVSSTLE